MSNGRALKALAVVLIVTAAVFAFGRWMAVW
jgi:hypothetical protein